MSKNQYNAPYFVAVVPFARRVTGEQLSRALQTAFDDDAGTLYEISGITYGERQVAFAFAFSRAYDSSQWNYFRDRVRSRPSPLSEIEIQHVRRAIFQGTFAAELTDVGKLTIRFVLSSELTPREINVVHEELSFHLYHFAKTIAHSLQENEWVPRDFRFKTWLTALSDTPEKDLIGIFEESIYEMHQYVNGLALDKLDSLRRMTATTSGTARFAGAAVLHGLPWELTLIFRQACYIGRAKLAWCAATFRHGLTDEFQAHSERIENCLSSATEDMTEFERHGEFLMSRFSDLTTAVEFGIGVISLVTSLLLAVRFGPQWLMLSLMGAVLVGHASFKFYSVVCMIREETATVLQLYALERASMQPMEKNPSTLAPTTNDGLVASEGFAPS